MLTFNSENHEYSFGGVSISSVTQVLQSAGLIDVRWFTEESRRRGQAVHLACQYLDEDDLNWNSIAPEYAPYVQAYINFKTESGFITDQIEHRVYNVAYKYAGTLDRTGRLNNKNVILDLKSGSVSDWAGLQLAAYLDCLGRPMLRYALQLNDDSSYKLHQFSDRSDFNVFIAALAITNWKRNRGQK